MSNYNSLKTTIDANIKQKGRQEITGQILNSVLNQMVNILGTGYQFAGVATTATNPGSPDAKVFYIANGKGTYNNFGGIEVTEDEVVFLYWDSSWHKVSTGIASQWKLTELKEKVDALALGAFYGYFPDSSSLPVDVTTPGYAYVGLDNPYKIWNFNGESWSDSGTSIDMNDADEEDITRNADGKLQFKDRAYGDGMGYVILRKDKTFAEQVTQANTIYEIRYDFTLSYNVVIPTNCVLYFNGGSISNGTIVGGSFEIKSNSKRFLKSNLIINATISNDTIESNWFDIQQSAYDNENIIISIGHILSGRSNVHFKLTDEIKTFAGLYIQTTSNLVIDGGGHIYKYAESFEMDNVAICLYDVENINIDGIKITIETISRSAINKSYRYYHIWARPENIAINKCYINNCTFIDNNSLIDSSVKPYNGSIWVGGYQNVSNSINITNNKFLHNCGRVIYCTNSEDVIVTGNHLIDLDYFDYTPTNKNSMELIAIRLIGCYNNIVANNEITVADNTMNGREIIGKIINIVANDNTEHQYSKKSVVSSNIIDVSKSNNKYAIIYLEKSKEILVTNNTITLCENSDMVQYLVYYNESGKINNIVIINNDVYNMPRSGVFIWGMNGDCDIAITENRFYTTTMWEVAINLQQPSSTVPVSKLYYVNNSQVMNSYAVLYKCGIIRSIGSSSNKNEYAPNEFVYFNMESRQFEMKSEVDNKWVQLTTPIVQ